MPQKDNDDNNNHHHHCDINKNTAIIITTKIIRVLKSESYTVDKKQKKHDKSMRLLHGAENQET